MTLDEMNDPDSRARADEWLVVRCQLGERPERELGRDTR
jgi:hypothetical protein